MKVLVCGGAGYIGSHMLKRLRQAGHDTVVFDNLSTGHAEAVLSGELVQGDLLDRPVLKALFAAHRFDLVMHFSAKSLVGESVTNPAIYFENNVIGTWNLLEAMREAGVKRFIFSSTAAIFGQPVSEFIAEDHPNAPINPYGKSKLMVEQMLADYAAAYGLDSVSLRYFNAAGADAEGELGEDHQPETHLIPNVLKSVLGTGPELKLFGDDYPTRDGTCVRDYIHVEDLAEAHLLAAQYLDKHPGCHAFNLGNGLGFSLYEVLAAAEKVVGKIIPFQKAPRRPGDPATLVADSARARAELGWQPKYPDIDTIIAHAWAWHSRCKCGSGPQWH
ncbi:MAG: UDP-glucose 4-epimerase GalE [Gammaproteobacteria bacterium]|nr:UDP-glucose 4-epimerase GalE [Gammaproteobacteria bacterium]